MRPEAVSILAVVGPGAGTGHLHVVHHEIVVGDGAHRSGGADIIRLIDNEFATQYPPVGPGAGGAEIDGDRIGPMAFRLGEGDCGAGAAATTILDDEVGIEVIFVRQNPRW